MHIKKISIILMIITAHQLCNAQHGSDFFEKNLKDTPKDTFYVNTLNKLAIQYSSTDIHKTFLFGSIALRISDSLKYLLGKADSYITLSKVSKAKANYDEELSLLTKSLKIYTQINKKRKIATTYSELSSLYNRKGDLLLAKEALYKCSEILSDISSKKEESIIKLRLGNISLLEKDHSKALEFYRQSLILSEGIKDENGTADCLNNMGLVFFEQRKFDSAYFYHKKALKIYEEKNNKIRLPAVYHNIAKDLLSIGALDSALIMAQKGQPIAMEMNIKFALVESYKVQSDIFIRMGNPLQAYNYTLLYAQQKDSIYNEEKSDNFERLKSLYLINEKESELALANKNTEIIKLQQRFYIAFSLLIIITLWLFFIRQRSKARREALIRQKQEEIFEVETRLLNSELKNRELSEQKVRQDLEIKEKELLSRALNLIQKNRLLDEIKIGLNILSKDTTDQYLKEKLKKISSSIYMSFHQDREWEEFIEYYEKVNNIFFERLNTHFPQLSKNDLKLCALIKLNLETTQIASILRISLGSFKVSRHRLRKKLGLSDGVDIYKFLSGLSINQTEDI